VYVWCLCRGGGSGSYAGALLFAALGTLPATDQEELYAAELDMNRWRSNVHSYPSDTSSMWIRMGGIASELRLAFYTAGFSQNAHTTVMEHLSGTRPLENWDPMKQVQCTTQTTDWFSAPEVMID
jgi:hypothetical protein